MPFAVRKPACDARADAPVAAGIVFVAPDGDVLLLRRASTEKNYGGHWGLPGGGGNAGETAADAARREFREECGLDIDMEAGLKLLDRVDTPNGMQFSTFAQATDEKFVPTLDGEHSGYCWASLDMLPQPLHPSVKKALGEHIGAAADMTPEDWAGLRAGFAKWTREEEHEPEHHGAMDAVMAMDLYDRRTGKRIILTDRIALDKAPTVRTYDRDGQLHISRTPCSKANIGTYFGHEIPGADVLGLEPDRKYRLLRDPVELSKGAKSCNGKQLLIQHVPVDADDHQPDLTVGAFGTDAEYEHPYLYNSLHVHAREGISGIEDDSRREISMGYHYKPVMEPGIYEGEPYDGRMTEIEFNHGCLVEKGRAGADVLVKDSALVENEWLFIEQALLALGGAAGNGEHSYL